MYSASFSENKTSGNKSLDCTILSQTDSKKSKLYDWKIMGCYKQINE